MTETELQKQIKAFCDSQLGVKIERMPAGRPGKNFRAQAGSKGVADLVGVAYGVPLGLEVKRPGYDPVYHLTQNRAQFLGQRMWEWEWVDAGGLYWIVSSEMETALLLRSLRSGFTL